jgi:hypothetical protein
MEGGPRGGVFNKANYLKLTRGRAYLPNIDFIDTFRGPPLANHRAATLVRVIFGHASRQEEPKCGYRDRKSKGRSFHKQYNEIRDALSVVYL